MITISLQNNASLETSTTHNHAIHDDVVKFKHFPRFWPFVRRIHRWPVNSPHTGQWRGALMFSLDSTWINGWVNNHEAGDLRRHCAYYDVTVMRTNDSITTPRGVILLRWLRSLTNFGQLTPYNVIEPSNYIHYPSFAYYLSSQINLLSNTFFLY